MNRDSESDGDGDLLPLRMLNEYAYCPRLYHLMHVEGHWADNAFTVEGKSVHRRVDKIDQVLPSPLDKESPAKSTEPAGDEPPVIVRSVPLASEPLGLMAKLDLASCDPEGGEAVPVFAEILPAPIPYPLSPVPYQLGFPMRRRRYLFSYDVTDDKRRSAIFDCLRDNGDHAQYSVFFCELSPREHAALTAQLTSLVHPRDDQILILDLGDAEAPWEAGLATLGKGFSPPLRSHIF